MNKNRYIFLGIILLLNIPITVLLMHTALLDILFSVGLLILGVLFIVYGLQKRSVR